MSRLKPRPTKTIYEIDSSRDPDKKNLPGIPDRLRTKSTPNGRPEEPNGGAPGAPHFKNERVGHATCGRRGCVWILVGVTLAHAKTKGNWGAQFYVAHSASRCEVQGFDGVYFNEERRT